MTSVEDDAAMGVALGDATSAGEILALRDELSEKELELLELQQSLAELVAKHDEVKAQLKKASRFKEDSANILQSAVKFKEEAQITAKNATERADKLQADLKSTREAAASAKKMATHFKEKCEAEHERAAAAESAAAALRGVGARAGMGRPAPSRQPARQGRRPRRSGCGATSWGRAALALPPRQASSNPSPAEAAALELGGQRGGALALPRRGRSRSGADVNRGGGRGDIDGGPLVG